MPFTPGDIVANAGGRPAVYTVEKVYDDGSLDLLDPQVDPDPRIPDEQKVPHVVRRERVASYFVRAATAQERAAHEREMAFCRSKAARIATHKDNIAQPDPPNKPKRLE